MPAVCMRQIIGLNATGVKGKSFTKWVLLQTRKAHEINDESHYTNSKATQLHSFTISGNL